MEAVRPNTGAAEVVLAEDQPEYTPLPTALYRLDGVPTRLTRWTFTVEERALIAAGEDLYLAVLTFDNPFQPVILQVGPEGWVVDPLTVLDGPAVDERVQDTDLRDGDATRGEAPPLDTEAGVVLARVVASRGLDLDDVRRVLPVAAAILEGSRAEPVVELVRILLDLGER